MRDFKRAIEAVGSVGAIVSLFYGAFIPGLIPLGVVFFIIGLIGCMM